MNEKLQEEMTVLAMYRASGLTAEECIQIGREIYKNDLTVEKLLKHVERWIKNRWNY